MSAFWALVPDAFGSVIFCLALLVLGGVWLAFSYKMSEKKHERIEYPIETATLKEFVELADANSCTEVTVTLMCIPLMLHRVSPELISIKKIWIHLVATGGLREIRHDVPVIPDITEEDLAASLQTVVVSGGSLIAFVQNYELLVQKSLHGVDVYF